jgi:glucokinase
VDVTSGEIKASEFQPTPSAQGAKASLKVMLRAGQSVINQSSISTSAINGIGISFGGPISQDRCNVLRSMHIPDWDAFPLPNYVADTFGLPTFMDNDGNAAALGEWYFGAGRGTDNMLYIQVSTGVGAGLILDRQVYRGMGLAAEFGHLTVMADGPQCACGKRGCVESLAAGWALARYGQEAYASAGAGSALKTLGDQSAGLIDAQLVINAYRQNDPLAKEIIERGFKYLGLGIGNAIVLLDPQMVTIGGGVSRAWDVMYPQLQSSLAHYLPSMFQNRTRIELSRLHGTETLLGAALLTLGF